MESFPGRACADRTDPLCGFRNDGHRTRGELAPPWVSIRSAHCLARLRAADYERLRDSFLRSQSGVECIVMSATATFPTLSHQPRSTRRRGPVKPELDIRNRFFPLRCAAGFSSTTIREGGNSKSKFRASADLTAAWRFDRWKASSACRSSTARAGGSR